MGLLLSDYSYMELLLWDYCCLTIACCGTLAKRLFYVVNLLP